MKLRSSWTRRRALMRGIAGAAAWPVAALAQSASGQPPRIGYLGSEPASGPHPELDVFLAGLRELGYIEGRTLAIEYRMANYDQTLFARYAAELVALKVSAIVAFAPVFTAAMAATREIPIVIRTTIDPVQAGYVESLARPGGNVTGVSSVSGDLYRKRVELLVDLMPRLRRVAVLWVPGGMANIDYRDQVTAACARLGLTALPIEVNSAEDLGQAISAAAAGAEALVPVRSPLIVSQRKHLAELAAASRLPTIYDERAFVLAGGLISYGANLAALHRRAAYYVDRILHGTPARDLPVEEPTVFELVINQKAAPALGIAIPPSILARADEVIE